MIKPLVSYPEPTSIMNSVVTFHHSIKPVHYISAYWYIIEYSLDTFN
jgi:hypothetical protein